MTLLTRLKKLSSPDIHHCWLVRSKTVRECIEDGEVRPIGFEVYENGLRRPIGQCIYCHEIHPLDNLDREEDN